MSPQQESELLEMLPKLRELTSGNDSTLHYHSLDRIAESDTIDLTVGGDLSVEGDLTVAGDFSFSTATGFRNVILGGDFNTNPWQRGTTITAPASLYSADRFMCTMVGGGLFDVSCAADSPSINEAGVYSPYSFKATVTTADATMDAADQYEPASQLIEGYNAARFGLGQAGVRHLTLSFWVKATTSGVYCVSFRNGVPNRSYVTEYTIFSSNTWERKVITVPVDTGGTWLYDTGIGLRVTWAMGVGSNLQTTAGTWAVGNYTASPNQVNNMGTVGNSFSLNLIQLEEGSLATPFESRPISTERALCQRYYYRTTADGVADILGVGYVTTASVTHVWVPYPVTMRSGASSLDQSGTATDYAVLNLNTATVCSAVPTQSSSNSAGCRVILTTAAVLVAGQGAMCYANSATAYLGFSAEL